MIILIASFLGTSQDKNTEKIDIKIISYNIHSGTDKNMAPTLFDTINFLKKSNACFEMFVRLLLVMIPFGIDTVRLSIVRSVV